MTQIKIGPAVTQYEIHLHKVLK
ncbi:hypothetical protein ACFOJG_01070 [Staphylococcus saprophyticus]